MSSPRSRHLLGLAGVAVCLVALTACGNKQPTAQATSTGQGQAGEVTSTPTSPTATATSTGNGTGGGNQGPSYQTTAKDYGLALLQLIPGNDETKIVDLSGSGIYLFLQQNPEYKTKNASWTWTDCTSGGTQTCHYFNQTGDIAQVVVDASKLGKAHAVSSVYFNQGTYPTDPSSYVGAFYGAWGSSNYAMMVALSSTNVANHVQGLQTLEAQGAAGTSTSQPYTCGSKTCVRIDPVGGTANPAPLVFTVDTAKISQGKPGGITGWQ
jgi:hypothetical protein